MMGNTMFVSQARFQELRRTGRVKGGDPNLTASAPTTYTDENGIEWTLAVDTGTAGPNMNLPAPRRPLNRAERRAAVARARRTK